MELRTYWKILLRRWWLVVAPVLVVAVYAAATYAPPGPVYQVVMRFSAGTKPADLSEDYDRYYPWLASEYIANGLADVARTGVFAEAVAERVGDPSLAGAIQGGIVTDSAQSVMVVYFTWADSVQIVGVAEAIAAELMQNGAAYFPQLTGVEPAVHLLDEPIAMKLEPGLRTKFSEPAIRIGLALVIGTALVFLWHYLDPTIREAQDLEGMELAVLAQIPRRRWFRHLLRWLQRPR